MQRLILAAAIAACLPTFAAEAPLAPPLAAFVPSQQAMAALVQRYQLDFASLDHRYTVQNGAARNAELARFYQQWQAALDALPFDGYGVDDRIDGVMLRNQIDAVVHAVAVEGQGVDDRIDWVMLRNQIEFEQREQAAQAQRFAEAEPL